MLPSDHRRPAGAADGEGGLDHTRSAREGDRLDGQRDHEPGTDARKLSHHAVCVGKPRQEPKVSRRPQLDTRTFTTLHIHVSQFLVFQNQVVRVHEDRLHV